MCAFGDKVRVPFSLVCVTTENGCKLCANVYGASDLVQTFLTLVFVFEFKFIIVQTLNLIFTLNFVFWKPSVMLSFNVILGVNQHKMQSPF